METPAECRVLCVGDLNADVTVEPSVEIVPGSDTPGTVQLSPGGSAANVAAWSVVPPGAHVASRFAGVVGDDVLGQLLIDDLTRHGVEVEVTARVNTTTRSIAALIAPNGDRSMVSDPTAAGVLSADDVRSDWFDDVAWLHLTGYTFFNEHSRSAFIRLIGEATSRGLPWSFDPSSAVMIEQAGPDGLREVVAHADVIFPNHVEATALCGVDEPSAAAKSLLDLAETVVVTCGEQGSVVARRGGDSFVVAPPEVSVVVNALGCGDAFAAGFLCGRVRGLDDRSSAELATINAGRALQLATSRELAVGRD